MSLFPAFAFVEAITTVIHDTKFFDGTPRWKIALVFCLCGWLFSFIYATDAGLNFLDVVDFYINFVMLIVGFFESFAAGWVYGLAETVDNCGVAATAVRRLAVVELETRVSCHAQLCDSLTLWQILVVSGLDRATTW